MATCQTERSGDGLDDIRLQNPPITGKSVTSAFRRAFGRQSRLFRAPARVNIIGEHCDYNDGFVMPTNTALYTWLAIAPRNDRVVRIRTLDFEQETEFELDAIQQDPDGGWQEYPKGVIQIMQNEGYRLNGADILITGEIPLGGGLSSSASLETVTALAMLTISNHEVDRQRLALICQAAENEFVGVSCGIMDQYVISLCQRNQAIMLDCRSLEYKPAPLPADAQLLIVNSGVKHQLSEGGYNERRGECEQAVTLLAASTPEITALRDVSMLQVDSHRETLGDVLYRRCRHVVTEIQRVRDAFLAMYDNDPVTLGHLMNLSHESLRDDFEVSCSELDSLVDIARNCDGVHGSRMVGAGFGGCTVSLVAHRNIQAVTTEICRQYHKILGRVPWYQVVEASDPVGEIPRQS
jgi:galactokinase